jgi:hypothetical protein
MPYIRVMCIFVRIRARACACVFAFAFVCVSLLFSSVDLVKNS